MSSPTWKDASKPAGPVTLKNGWILEVDHGVCIGAASCTAMAAHAFALDETNKADILASVDQEDYDAIVSAARGCPVSAIRITDANGTQIFPA